MKRFNLEMFGSKANEEEIKVPDIEGRKNEVASSSVQEKIYTNIGEAPIEVTWQEFDPIHNEERSKKGSLDSEIVFLPGVGLDVGTKTSETIGESYARSPKGGKTYVVRSKIRQKVEDSTNEENEAIKKLIEEKQLDNFILAGQSQGGDRAISLAAALGEKVRALVLIDSVGLYEQEPGDLAKKFFKDSGIDTPPALAAHLLKGKKDKFLATKRGMQSGVDIAFGIANDIRRIRKEDPDYRERIKKEVQAGARANPLLSEIKVPVIVISGRHDPISDPSMIAPAEKQGPEWDQYIDYLHEREAALGKLFPNSPWCKMIVPEKLGHHGVQIFRPEAVATAALGSIERGEREAKSEE